MVIGGATAPDYFFFILSHRSFFYLSQKAFFLSLADGADLADLYDKPMSCNEKICVICAICEKIISLREIIETVVSVRALRDFSSELFGSFKNSAYLCA
jgi:hypothetical protein